MARLGKRERKILKSKRSKNVSSSLKKKVLKVLQQQDSWSLPSLKLTLSHQYSIDKRDNLDAALSFLKSQNLIHFTKSGNIILGSEPLSVQIDDDPLRSNIEKNRQEYINRIRKTWGKLNDRNWESFLKNRSTVTAEVEYLSRNVDHYSNQDKIPGDVKEKANTILSTLAAIFSGNQNQFIDVSKPFKWPSTTVLSVFNTHNQQFELDDTGLFRTYGYRVGNKGLSQQERLRVLDKIFGDSSQLSEQVGGSFGHPLSCARLRRMAYTISFFIKRANRQIAKDYSNAVDDWENDLRYLKREYYDGNCDGGGFRWPL